MLYSQRWLARGHLYAMHSDEMLDALGVKGGHLPVDGINPRQVQGVTVYVLAAPPSNGRKSSKHRVMAVCPTCGRHMSAGRLVSQHIKVHNPDHDNEWNVPAEFTNYQE